MVILDTTKTGYALVFGREWKATLMEHILNSEEEFTTADAHNYVLEQGYDISRASVINFLQEQQEEASSRETRPPGRSGGLWRIWL